MCSALITGSALIISPIVVGAARHDHRANDAAAACRARSPLRTLLTFGLALIIQGVFQNYFGSSGLPYAIPRELSGGTNLGFMFLPNYRGWVIIFSLIVCLATWFMIERTRLGAYLRAATENPALVRAFGINVPRMVTLTYGFGVALAALAGVLAAPINQVRPLMGADFIIVVFAVVVIGGMGSIIGLDRHRLFARPHRGADQGILSRGIQHGDLCHHGDRVACEARRALRKDRLTCPSIPLPNDHRAVSKWRIRATSDRFLR